MINAAFIPVRGGSKSIPLKNIRQIAGKPLVYWTTKAANDCICIDKVFVATDSTIIRETVESFHMDKVQVIGRDESTASDTASTESAMLEFADNYAFDNIVLIQATSPLLQASDLEGGFHLFEQKDTDSVLSVVRQKRFHWQIREDGYASPTNYDVFHRPRRQEFKGYLVENGAFYITSRENLIKYQNRVSGNIRTYEMDESTYFEIDEPSDWLIIEQQLLHRKRNTVHKIPDIKMFLTDCDGCLTDGGMYYSENGDELKKFNTKDGMGFRLLKEAGIITGIITSENRELNARRAGKLMLNELYQGVSDKVEVIRQLCQKYGISPENVAYVGDDRNDLKALAYVGFSCTVNDASTEVKKRVDYVSSLNGGQGAMREIIDMILQAETD